MKIWVTWFTEEKRREELLKKYMGFPIPTRQVYLEVDFEMGKISREEYEKKIKEVYQNNYTLGFGW